ncbi:MAG: ATP-dependent Clp protease ATP-binding subunit ClpC, partial [Lachnospiraceae bacterium]|nr:ATP-dependent Clp protease ATP-binding subunit ClpC [Lachnospiraceae bacterium]
MQPQFTDKARTALNLAERAARNFKQSYVGTEHILLGLLRENTGVAATVLENSGVEEYQIKEMIKDLIAPESTVMLAEKDGYSPRAE